MGTTGVAELRAAGRWPEVWSAVMAEGGVDAVLALAATMTDDEIDADLRARQAQSASIDCLGSARSRIEAQRSVLDHAASHLPPRRHSA